MQNFIKTFARICAIAGGIVLSAIILMVCLSIVGRAINGALHSDTLVAWFPGLSSALLATGVGPIIGDNELLEAGMAFAIFAFLPVTQLYAAHASVDIFTNRLSRKVNRGLAALFEIVFAAVLILIAVQLFQGMLSKLRSGQTTFYLQFPIWWAYAGSMFGAAAAAFVACYVAVARCIEISTGRSLLPDELGSDH